MGDKRSMEKIAVPGIDPNYVRAQLRFDHSLTLATSLAHTHSLTHSFSSWRFPSLVLSSSALSLILVAHFITITSYCCLASFAPAPCQLPFLLL